MHRFVLWNGSLREASERVLSPGQVGLLSGWGVFSTIRVLDGVLFAFERHWQRMKKDAGLLAVPFPENADELHGQLLELVEANQAWNATLRVVVVRNRGGMWEGPGLPTDYDLIALTTGLQSWGRSVSLAMQPQARHAGCPLAGAKMLSWSFNLLWLERARQRGFDEVILLNERGEVSECTSANIFAANGGEVATPPLSSGCLAGVTRDLLLHEVRAPGVSVVERPLRPEDLEQAEEVFITSTTRVLLPVASIEGKTLRGQGVNRRGLQDAFARYVDEYVRRASLRAAPGALTGHR